MRRPALLAVLVGCLAVAGTAAALGTATTGVTDAGSETVPPRAPPPPPDAGADPTPDASADPPPVADAGPPPASRSLSVGNRSSPRIAAVHPNPIAAEDRGEFVAVAAPTPTNLSGWTITDGESTVGLPNRTVEGTVAVSAVPDRARNLTDHPAFRVDALALSNAGETVRLRYRGAVVDAVTYGDAPEGEVHRDGEWRPVGATNRSVAVVRPRSVRAFVLPDAPGATVETLRSADRRILLAGYTLGSERVVRALRRAARRGVRVEVLVDAAPVGGMSRREARLLDSLVAAGVDVRAFGGEGAPYAFHHAKYAVVDDSALVLTENFEPAGTGGRSSRGWGAVVRGDGVAAELAAVFRADATGRGAIPWSTYRENVTLVDGGAVNGSYPARFAPRKLPVERGRVLVAPDNAERAIVDVFDGAERSIRIEGATMERGPLLNATLRAARRGVRVRILLSGAWYAREENRNLTDALNRRADREGLDLVAKIADPRSRYGKIHAKGAVVDGRTVVLGSLNWNDHSAERNREVVVVLTGERVGRYYGRVFRADWRGGAWRLPAGLGVVVLLAVLLAGGVGVRSVEFDPPRETGGAGAVDKA